jgi:cytoskeleton protein RodZ
MTTVLLESNTEQELLKSNVGEQLRLARINQNLSIEDISNRLKWPSSKISAIEANEYEKLGGLTFIRGFVRSYANLLGLEADALLSELALQLQDSTQLNQADTIANVSANQEPKIHRYGLFLFLLTLALLATFLWIYGHKPKSPQAPIHLQTPVTKPELMVASEPLASQVTASQVVANSASNSQNSRLRLILVKPSYFTLIDAKGNKLHSGLLTAEAPAEFEGLAPFKITIGAASDAQLFFNGVSVPLADKIKGGVARLNLGE